MWTHVGPRNRVLGLCLDPSNGKGKFFFLGGCDAAFHQNSWTICFLCCRPSLPRCSQSRKLQRTYQSQLHVSVPSDELPIRDADYYPWTLSELFSLNFSKYTTCMCVEHVVSKKITEFKCCIHWSKLELCTPVSGCSGSKFLAARHR